MLKKDSLITYTFQVFEASRSKASARTVEGFPDFTLPGLLSLASVVGKTTAMRRRQITCIVKMVLLMNIIKLP